MRLPFFGHVNAISRTAALGAAIALICSVAGIEARAESASALPAAAQPVAMAGAAKPMAAWTRFCAEQPAECTVDVSEPAVITLTPREWRLLVQVNRQVNAAIKPRTDMDHWGEEDRWDFADDGYGDCEDYQLVKRKLLVAAGFPRRALRMTVVIDEEGAGHAVMMVRTDRGDFILDNKRDAVLPWSKTGYTYVKREGDDGMTWASLGRAVASPVATAGR